MSAIKGRWSRIGINDRYFVYGPRLGALYVLSIGQIREHLFYRIFGLRRFQFTDQLNDPATKILYDVGGFKEMTKPSVSSVLCFAYQFIHWSRNIIPFNLMLRWMTRLAYFGRKAGRTRSPSEIGQMLHFIEQKIGIRNCYPRSIITAYLCSRNKLPWDVAIGVLAPTRMMHAWCSTNGILPYEPYPEHHMYQPLVVFSWTRSQNIQ